MTLLKAVNVTKQNCSCEIFVGAWTLLTVADIVEKVTEEQRKALQFDEYVIANNDNDNEHNNNNNNNMETDMFSNDNDNDISSQNFERYEDRNSNVRHAPQSTSVGGDDGQVWWASRIESVVNGNKHTSDDVIQWPQVRNSDVVNEDAVKTSPSNDDGANSEQHSDWSMASGHDWTPEVGHVTRYDDGPELNDASSHHTWVLHDAAGDRIAGQRSSVDNKDYRSTADGRDQDQHSQSEPTIDQLMQPSSLNSYITKDDAPPSSDNYAC